MAQTIAAERATAPSYALPQSGWIVTLLRFAQQRTLGAAGGVFVVLMALAALLAPIISPHDPLENSFIAILKPPSGEFWLGTDPFGRDVFSRVLWGARTALLVGFASSFIGSSLGAVLGVMSAYW